MVSNRRVLAVAILVVSLGSAVQAQTSYPMLMSLKPTAAQVGQTSEHEVNSRYSMYGAFQVLVTGAGVTGEVVPPDVKPKEGEAPPNLQKIKVRFTVAADALPGVRDFRIATPQGVSTLGQLVIAGDPVVSEQANNDKAEQAQEITLPATVCGGIEKAEDVDYFKFKVEAGTAYSFHVRSMRLQDKIHDLQAHADPILALRNASGTTLATSDNYFYGDPFLSYRFTHAGEYFLEIRDVRYQGNQYWEYSIEINDRPFVTNVFPLGVTAGSEAQLELVGFQLPSAPTIPLTVPTDLPPGPQWLRLPMGAGPSNPVPVVVSDLPAVVEAQPAEADNNTPTTAQPITVPSGISGRIEREADIDCYAFEAKKGEAFSIEAIARRQQSALDSNLRIIAADGRQLAENDDLRLDKRLFADSWIENFTAPADGKYTIEIRDLHLRGGAEFVYFLKVTRVEPYFDLYVDTDKTQLTPGSAGVLFASVVRKNGFDGDVQLAIEGLPDGVTATCGRILAGKGRDGCIVLQAAPTAEMKAANITVIGKAVQSLPDGTTGALTARATPYQETYQPGGGRGHWTVEMHTVAIGAPSDIRAVKLSTTEIALKPGESQRIDITIERAPGFTQNVQLDPLFRHLDSVYANTLPEGVTVDAKNSKTLLNGADSSGYITLTAAANAPAVEKQQFAVMANVSLNFVMKATYSSPPLVVSVTK
jgi:hypothetical protein